MRGGKVTFVGFVFIGGCLSFLYSFQTIMLMHEYPTPETWTWKAMKAWRGAFIERNQGLRTGLINWAAVGKHFARTLEQLEDPKKDGKNIVPLQEDTAPGELREEAAFDLSNESQLFIDCYHTSLMGVGKAAEQCEFMMIDESQNLLIPRDIVVGPSNPKPSPMQPSPFKIPLEENCVECFDSAEKYYLKALRTNGFNTRQRMEVTLALADWYDYKGFTEQAKAMYDLGFNLARRGLPENAQKSVDNKTGIIDAKAEFISANLLTASTALAQYEARHNNLNGALQIFLSILRARRNLMAPMEESTQQEPIIGTWSEWGHWAKALFIRPPPLPLQTDGNERPVRTVAAICEESAVMKHIGELLLATSISQNVKTDPATGKPKTSFITSTKGFESGLGWTRDAVSLAETTLSNTRLSDSMLDARDKCASCMIAGMDNWQAMVNRRLQEVRTAEFAPRKSSVGNLFWGHNQTEDLRRWEGEAEDVEKRSRAVRRKMFNEEDRPLSIWMKLLTQGRGPGM